MKNVCPIKSLSINRFVIQIKIGTWSEFSQEYFGSLIMSTKRSHFRRFFHWRQCVCCCRRVLLLLLLLFVSCYCYFSHRLHTLTCVHVLVSHEIVGICVCVPSLPPHMCVNTELGWWAATSKYIFRYINR